MIIPIPLGAEAIAELVRDLLGDDPSVAALPERIRERTGGNPFFTEEVVQSLIESGQVEGSRGAYRLVTAVERIQVPDRVQAVLAARIDRLGEREKQVLQAAAVIGRVFDAELLAALAELPDLDLRGALEALDMAEMVRATALYHVAEYTFKHPLTHEVALESQLQDRRRQRHAAAARALEARHADKLDENAALLAYHFEEAGESLAAARWHRRAAERIGFNDVAEALRHWPRVLDLVEGLPDTEAADLGLEACSRLLTLGGHQGIDLDTATSLLRQGRQLARRGTDPEGLPRVLLGYGLARGLVGEISEGLEAMREAEVLARELVDPSPGLEIGVWAGWALLSLGRLSESAETYERIVAEECTQLAPTMGAPVNVAAWIFLAWTLFEGGKLVESADALASSRRLASGVTLGALSEAVTLMTECRVFAHQGDLGRGLHVAGEMVELAERSRNADITSSRCWTWARSRACVATGKKRRQHSIRA